jgi:hypothetical protein
MPSFFEAAWEISSYTDYTAYLERDPETRKATSPQPNIAVGGFSLSPPLLSRDRPRLSPRKPKMKNLQPVKQAPIIPSLTPPDRQEMDLSDDDGDYPTPPTSAKLFYPSPPSEDRFLDGFIPEYGPMYTVILAMLIVGRRKGRHLVSLWSMMIYRWKIRGIFT